MGVEEIDIAPNLALINRVEHTVDIGGVFMNQVEEIAGSCGEMQIDDVSCGHVKSTERV